MPGLYDTDGRYRVTIGSGNADFGPSNPIPVASSPSFLPEGTNRSGTVAAANTAQTLAPANTSRRSLTGQNISNGELWISETGTAAINAAGSFRIPAGQGFSVVTNRAISIVGGTAGQAFTATET